jgi:hypothetical protein
MMGAAENISDLRTLLSIVAEETGALKMSDADEDSVGWTTEGQLPMTFGHVRRAHSALAALEAALSAAEPVEKDKNPMRFFADNVDNWGALEWFNRMVDACEDHDRKRMQAFRCADADEKDMLSLSADTSKMIMSSSAFHLARKHKDEILSALSAQVQDVAEREPKEIATWEEQQAFEAWAKGERYEMHQHPLHYLFMDPKTNAARKGWKAALQFIRDRSAAAPAKQEGGDVTSQ